MCIRDSGGLHPIQRLPLGLQLTAIGGALQPIDTQGPEQLPEVCPVAHAVPSSAATVSVPSCGSSVSYTHLMEATLERIKAIFLDNLRRYVEGRTLRNQVR